MSDIEGLVTTPYFEEFSYKIHMASVLTFLLQQRIVATIFCLGESLVLYGRFIVLDTAELFLYL